MGRPEVQDVSGAAAGLEALVDVLAQIHEVAAGSSAAAASVRARREGTCWGSNGRSLVQTPNAWCSSLRMQCPRATSPRVPRARRRLYSSRTAGLCTIALFAAFHR